MVQADLNIILPEIVISVYAMVALLVAVYTRQDKLAPILTWVTAGLFLVVGLWVSGITGNTTAFDGMFVNDGFARFA